MSFIGSKNVDEIFVSKNILNWKSKYHLSICLLDIVRNYCKQNCKKTRFGFEFLKFFFLGLLNKYSIIVCVWNLIIEFWKFFFFRFILLTDYIFFGNHILFWKWWWWWAARIWNLIFLSIFKWKNVIKILPLLICKFTFFLSDEFLRCVTFKGRK